MTHTSLSRLAHYVLFRIARLHINLERSRIAVSYGCRRSVIRVLRLSLHISSTIAMRAAPHIDFAAITLVAHILACAFALPAHLHARALASLTLRSTLAVAVLALSPFVLDLHTASAATMGANDLS